MPEKFIACILAMLLTLSAAAQEDATDEKAEPESADVEQAAADESEQDEDEEDELDDSDLDIQTYEEDDDDFVPTEEVPADEPIPFPTNI